MYYFLEGVVAHCETKLLVIDCAGVGYLVIPSAAAVGKARLGQKMKVYTHLLVREEVFDLYGFADAEEKSCFLMLLSISGVGPKAALAILSASTPEQLAMRILNEDEKALTVAPGVGKKLAQRIILELKDKLAKQIPVGGGADFAPAAFGTGPAESAVAALVVLGYSTAEARRAVAALDPTGLATEEIIRRALKSIGE